MAVSPERQHIRCGDGDAAGVVHVSDESYVRNGSIAVISYFRFWYFQNVATISGTDTGCSLIRPFNYRQFPS
jgi:hypothetical protein